MKSHISIRDLNAFYTGHQALRNINIEIPEKQITAIIGPSGCGKSALLKCLNRLIELTDGTKVSGKIIVEHIYLGEITEQGPANEVFQNPKEERTRAYINGTFLDDLMDTETDLKGIGASMLLYMRDLKRIKFGK